MIGKPFEKGNSGKPKGAVSEKTKILNTFAQATIEGGIDRFNEELAKLQGEKYVNAFLTLLEYVRPKLARVTNVGDPENPLEQRLTVEVVHSGIKTEDDIPSN